MIKLRTGGRERITKHGYATREKPHPLYGRWKGMMQRCYYPDAASYRNYGAKDIEVEADWHDFSKFLDWWIGLVGPVFDKHEIHRIDAQANYGAANCTLLLTSEHRTLTKSKRVLCVNTGVEYADCQYAAIAHGLGRNSVSRAIRLRDGKIRDLQFVLCD